MMAVQTVISKAFLIFSAAAIFAPSAFTWITGIRWDEVWVGVFTLLE
jgi:hypothetical protein